MLHFRAKLKEITKMRVLVICQGRSQQRDVEKVFGWGLLFLAPCLLLRWTLCHGAPRHSQSQPPARSPSPQAACSWCHQLWSQHTGLLNQCFSPLPLCSHCPHVKGQCCQAPACSVLFCTWDAGPGKVGSLMPSSPGFSSPGSPSNSTPPFLKSLTVQGQTNNIIITPY